MTEVWVDLGCDVVCDVVWWYGHRVLICVGLGFGLVGGNVVVGLGRGGLWGYRLWWHGGFGCGLGGFGCGGAVVAWGYGYGWALMGLEWV